MHWLRRKKQRVDLRDVYIFDDRLASQFAKLDGFFPVNATMFGNSQGGNKNFHFTYELATEFVYSAAVPCLRGDPFGPEHLARPTLATMSPTVRAGRGQCH